LASFAGSPITDVRAPAGRLIAIGLDGYEPSLGDALMAAGEMPALAALRDRSARFLLDHGSAQRTGLAWEHVASGRSPEAAGRWSAVVFDPATYGIWQEGTSLEPFTARLNVPAVVFDPPYFDLSRAPTTRGVVNWGAHDPGVEADSRPQELLAEIESRFGPYPAKDSLYAVVWASAERTRAMGDALVRATDLRAEAACWLLQTRLPDWRLGLVVAGELHSATEGLWHGVDPAHPLHALPSAEPAGDGLRAAYRAADRLVGRLVAEFPAAAVVTFAMGGMGPNRSDVASMALLPELLYRHAFGRSLLQAADSNGRAPMLGENENWSVAVNARIPVHRSRWNRARAAGVRLLPWALRRMRQPLALSTTQSRERPARQSINWMPAVRYRSHWPTMPAFALPSFYDGRIRINLEGRERDGRVPLSGYEAACDTLEDILRACRDSATGEPVVEDIERCGGSDPRMLGPSAADLVVVWRGAAAGLDHPVLGRVGPLPFRRPGGHTGRYGMAYVSAPGITAGDYGVRSSFDVVPTIVGLAGETPPPHLSGRSLLLT
jgi:predicted AlkP superfamily phosphohydrolase/phosphomutase